MCHDRSDLIVQTEKGMGRELLGTKNRGVYYDVLSLLEAQAHGSSR